MVVVDFGDRDHPDQAEGHGALHLGALVGVAEMDDVEPEVVELVLGQFVVFEVVAG
jgi:hypothetical protein